MKKLLAVLMALGYCVVPGVAENTLVRNDTAIIFYGDSKEQIARQELDSDGNVVSTDGAIPDGRIAEYADEGTLAWEWMYKDGLVDGLVKRYFHSGKLSAPITYAQGKRNGPVTTYFENGKTQAAFTYRDGNRDGPGKVYTEKGTLAWEAVYADGRLDGTFKQYYDNGKPAVVESYKAGALTDRKVFDTRGAPVKTRTVSLYEGEGVDGLPNAVSEYGGGKYLALSKLALGASGLSGTVQCSSVQDGPFSLVIAITTATSIVYVYKDAERELTAAYSARRGLVPMFSTRGYTRKGTARQATLEFSVAGSVSGVYDLQGQARTVTVFCLDGEVDANNLPMGDDGTLASISNVLISKPK